MNYQPELIQTIIKMVTALILLVGGLWIISFYFKKILKTTGVKSGYKKIKVIENCYVGVKKTISLVEVPGEILVLGIAGDHISLLTKIEKTAMSEMMQENEVEIKNSPFLKQLVRLSLKTKTADQPAGIK